MPSLWNDIIIHVNQCNFLCCDPLISDSSYLPPDYLWWYKIEANTCLSKFIKHILVDNGSELLKTLAYTFDVGRAKVDSRFHKFLVQIQGRYYKVTLSKFSKTKKQKNPILLGKWILVKIIRFHWASSIGSEKIMENLNLWWTY